MLLLLGAAVPASGAGSSRKAIPTCPPAGAHVLLADAQAAIYTVHERLVMHFDGGGHEVQKVIATRGCVNSRKGSYKLGEEFVPTPTEVNGGIYRLALSGPIIAYEESFYGGNRYSEGRGEESVEEWHVVVRNLQTGSVLHKTPTGANEKDHPKFVGDGPTTAIVVKADGAVAWITDTVQSENRYQVHALDNTGERTLTVGSNINPNSLALAGSTLYWTQGGKSESAVLN